MKLPLRGSPPRPMNLFFDKAHKSYRKSPFHAMRPSAALRMYTARLTFFTRPNCGLCVNAKANVQQALKSRTVDYEEIDIIAEGQKKWRDVYEFDVPVLHVQRVFHTYSKPNIITEPQKLMHRFSPEEVEKLIDEAEQE